MASVERSVMERALLSSGIPSEKHATILKRFSQNTKLLEAELKAAEGALSLLKKFLSPGSSLTIGERALGIGKIGLSAVGKLFSLLKLIPKIGAIVGVGAAGFVGWKIYDYFNTDDDQTAAASAAGAQGAASEGASLSGDLYDRILQTIRLK